jgi:uncharacterized protein
MGRLTRLALRRPLAVLSVVTLVTAALVPGLLRLRSDASIGALLGAHHPVVERLEAFVEEFGGGYPTLLLWSCDPGDPCAHALDDASLAMASQLTAALERVPGVSWVQGPANAPLLVGDHEGFAIRYLKENGAAPRDIAALRARAAQDPLWLGNVISEDGSVGLVQVSFDSVDSEATARAVDGVLAALEPHRERGFEFRIFSLPVLIKLTEKDAQADSMRIVPGILLVIALVLWASCRSWRATAAVLATLLLSVAWTFGLYGWLDWPLTAVTNALAPCLLVIGVCTGIHLLSRHASERSHSPAKAVGDRKRTVEASFAQLGRPCLLASTTSAGAFLSFSASGAVTYIHFGVATGAGILIGLLLMFMVFPILLVALPEATPSEARASVAWSRALRRLVTATHRRWPAVLAASLLLAALGAWGMTRLEVEVRVRDTYGSRSQVVQWMDFMNERLRGSETLEIRLGLPPDRRLEDPEVLATVQALRHHLATVEGLGQSRSILDLLEAAHAALHGDDPAARRPGATAQTNAELLLLVAMAGQQVLDPWVTPDRRALRVSVESTAQRQREYHRILDALGAWAEPRLEEGWTLQPTGPFTLVQTTFDEVQRTQLASFLLAALTVFLLIALFFRSLRILAMAFLPAAVPVLLVFGAMGLLGIPLDMGTALVSAVVIGIAVDDIVHLLTHYETHRQAGRTDVEAMMTALLQVGRAVITTSLALALGFAGFVVSSWQTVVHFGLLCSVAIVAAALAVLFVLPATIFGVDAAWARRARPRLVPAARGPG